MKRMYVLALAVVALLTALPCDATGTGSATCSLAGTWYGSSPYTPFPYYQLMITETGADQFETLAQLLPANPPPPGYLNITDWTGTFSRSGPHTYSGMLFAMAQWDPNNTTDVPAGIDTSLPELNFIHAKSIEFLDCDTVRFAYDVLYVYENYTYSVTPIKTPPDALGAVVNFDPLLVEVYHRVPTSLSARHNTAGWPSPGRHHRRSR